MALETCDQYCCCQVSCWLFLGSSARTHKCKQQQWKTVDQVEFNSLTPWQWQRFLPLIQTFEIGWPCIGAKTSKKNPLLLWLSSFFQIHLMNLWQGAEGFCVRFCSSESPRVLSDPAQTNTAAEATSQLDLFVRYPPVCCYFNPLVCPSHRLRLETFPVQLFGSRPWNVFPASDKISSPC